MSKRISRIDGSGKIAGRLATWLTVEEKYTQTDDGIRGNTVCHSHFVHMLWKDSHDGFTEWKTTLLLTQ